MADQFADGTEVFRERTPEEMEAIAEENRKAARSNLRSQLRREADRLGMDFPIIGDRRESNRRAVLSSFERDMLLKQEDA